MLFSFPFLPAPLGRLHGSVCAFVRLLMSGARDGRNFDARTCCPGELKDRVKASAELRGKLKTFYNAFLALGPADRSKVYRAFVATNQIARQLAGTAERFTVDDLPEAIRVPSRELFAVLYSTGFSRAKCHEHWALMHAALPIKVCPFCGLERLHNPSLLKQDYDHVLCQRLYPFPSTNLRNLVPTGVECNRIFKHETDVIFDAGVRRLALYPFRDYAQTITVDLTGSTRPNPGVAEGQWLVRVLPDTQEIQTWVKVFKLIDRYAKDVFTEEYTTWREDFLIWARPQVAPPAQWTVPMVHERMTAYLATFGHNRFNDMRFLKQALFRFLLTENSPELFAAMARQLNSENSNRGTAAA
jgi:hypothetical protein